MTNHQNRRPLWEQACHRLTRILGATGGTGASPVPVRSTDQAVIGKEDRHVVLTPKPDGP